MVSTIITITVLVLLQLLARHSAKFPESPVITITLYDYLHAADRYQRGHLVPLKLSTVGSKFKPSSWFQGPGFFPNMTYCLFWICFKNPERHNISLSKRFRLFLETKIWLPDPLQKIANSKSVWLSKEICPHYTLFLPFQEVN